MYVWVSWIYFIFKIVGVYCIMEFLVVMVILFIRWFGFVCISIEFCIIVVNRVLKWW